MADVNNGIIVEEFGFTVYHKEIPGSLADRTGHLPSWNLQKLFQDLAFYTDKRHFSETLLKDALVFVIRENNRYFPHVFRQMRFPKKRTFLTMKTDFLSAGKTSYVSRQIAYLEGSDQILCIRDVLIARINPESRRPEPLPKGLLELKSRGKSSIVNKTPVLRPPQSCFKSSFKVQHGNTDSNQHLNAAEYFRFVMDCATEASLAGHFQEFQQDMCWYPLIEIDASYLGESVAGDEIEANCWQDDESTDKIYSIFYCKRKPIFQAVCVFDKTPYEKDSMSRI